jgi:antitoxin HigA-1
VVFENTIGIKADTILRMQAADDLAQARMREQEILVDRVAA